MTKQFGLKWAFEAFEDEPTFFSKKMFGGLAGYVHGKMVMVLVEDPGQRDYRGKAYSFDIWNGIMLPTSREYHEAIQHELSNLRPHPVLGKWLYLQMNDSHFEDTVEQISKFICVKDERFGISV